MNMEDISSQDQSQNGDHASVEEKIQHFRELLLNGEIEEAVQFRDANDLPEQTVNHNTRDAFDLHKETLELKTALKIAKKFGFPESEIQSVVLAEWNKLNKEKEYESAAEWAAAEGLADVEIHRSAKMAFEDYLQNDKSNEALDILEKYNLPKEELLGFAIAEFNKAFTAGQVYKAAMLGKVFNFSASRTLSAAIRACIASLSENQDEYRAIELMTEFKLGKDEVFGAILEKDAEKLLDNIKQLLIEPSFAAGKFQLMLELAEAMQLLRREILNKYLKDLSQFYLKEGVKAHNAMLKKGDVKPARMLRDSLNLFVAPIPYENYCTLVEAAEKYHKSLLENDDLAGALAFKKEYGIFDKYKTKKSKEVAAQHGAVFVEKSLEKAQIQPAIMAINEYGVPKEMVNDSVFSAVLDLIEKKSYKDAFAIKNEFQFNITKDKDRARVTGTFKEMMQEKEFEPASEFAKLFRMPRSMIQETAHKEWQLVFNAKKYNEALEIKKRFKIDRKLTLPLAKKRYWSYMNSKEYRMAVSIRNAYRVSIGLIQWIKEFILLLFSK